MKKYAVIVHTLATNGYSLFHIVGLDRKTVRLEVEGFIRSGTTIAIFEVI